MRRVRTGLSRLFCTLLLPALVAGLSGCTIYSEKKPATLDTTTSAEQVQRIFWQDVEQAKWMQANALIAPMAVWRVGDRVIARDQIVPWLQSLGIKGVQVSAVTLNPAVNDMNLVYTVQLQASQAVASQPAAASPSAPCASQPQTLSALAVWQQPQPTGDAAKDKKANASKAYNGYLLTVHDLAISANGACH